MCVLFSNRNAGMRLCVYVVVCVRDKAEDTMLKSLGIILFFYASKYVNYAFNMFPKILVLCSHKNN